MFSHVMVGTNNIERSKRFYDAVLAFWSERAFSQSERHRASAPVSIGTKVVLSV